MTIPAATVAKYAPHGNAQLSFQLANEVYSTDPATGNTITTTSNSESVEYLAAIKLQSPDWKGEPGADNTTYSCEGRLLTPAKLDTRITNGSQADAVINGYRGRFEFVWDLSMPKNDYSDLRQQIRGVFRVIGGP